MLDLCPYGESVNHTITAHSLAQKLLELEDLPIMVNVIKDPANFRITHDGWDADTELCELDPDDIEVKATAIIFVIELKDWEEEMDQLSD